MKVLKNKIWRNAKEKIKKEKEDGHIYFMFDDI